MVMPFNIVMTSSVFKLVFRKVFSAVCYTILSNSSNFTPFDNRQVRRMYMLNNLVLKSLSLIREIATRNPNRQTNQEYHLWMQRVPPSQFSLSSLQRYEGFVRQQRGQEKIARSKTNSIYLYYIYFLIASFIPFFLNLLSTTIIPSSATTEFEIAMSQ